LSRAKTGESFKQSGELSAWKKDVFISLTVHATAVENCILTG
jgi:hypothetical protein